MKWPIVAALAFAVACGTSEMPVAAEPLAVDVDDVRFVDGVTHRHLPLHPGDRRVFQQGLERIDVEVLNGIFVVNGISCTQTRSVVFIDETRIQDTYDRYAQDTDGNVWLLGEHTCAFEDDQCVSQEGSWAWGVGGGLPGIAVPAQPTVDGRRFSMALAPGAVEDVGEVIQTDGDVTVPAGTFGDCFTLHVGRLGPTPDELRSFCAGVGVVRTERPRTTEELVELVPGTL